MRGDGRALTLSKPVCAFVPITVSREDQLGRIDGREGRTLFLRKRLTSKNLVWCAEKAGKKILVGIKPGKEGFDVSSAQAAPPPGDIVRDGRGRMRPRSGHAEADRA